MESGNGIFCKEIMQEKLSQEILKFMYRSTSFLFVEAMKYNLKILISTVNNFYA